MSTKKAPTLAKPGLKSPEAALAFAEGGSRARVAARVFHAPEGYRRLTINLPEELHKRLKVRAAEQEVTVTKIIESLVEQKLGEE